MPMTRAEQLAILKVLFDHGPRFAKQITVTLWGRGHMLGDYGVEGELRQLRQLGEVDALPAGRWELTVAGDDALGDSE